ncbi:MAG: aspartyl aminopeptidase [Planctomycetota bacterium]|jgi:aspartyl aminopeptidase
MTSTNHPEAEHLAAFIDSSPSPYHACATAATALEAAGFWRLSEFDSWNPGPGAHYVIRGGTLIAWVVPEGTPAHAGFRVIGAHTDSPNLRIKPQPDVGRVGYRQLGVEVYGGVLLNSWLDRDLGLSGRAWVRGSNGPEAHLFKIDRPLMRVSQLAIHLDREISTKGLLLNMQKHMAPIWGLASRDERGFRDLLAAELEVDALDIHSWDAMCHDSQPSQVSGWDGEFLSAPRLDNLCSAFCGLEALLMQQAAGHTPARIPVLSLFDHEEVGSASRAGADGSILADVLERTVIARGGGREEYLRAIADSVCVSSDMAHATHPNYVDRHEPEHRLKMNGGPVIKVNSNQRYATEGETEAIFQTACESAGVPFQKFVGRTDLGCGSTIGPMTAAKLGMRVVDVGNPQLAMHSARELCGSQDPAYMISALNAFLG